LTWITASDVKQCSQVKYNMVGFTLDADYETWINGTLLPRCESIIEDYCGQEFSDVTVSESVKTVCAMLAARTLQFMIMNATGPIVRIDDWQVKSASLEVFSEDLKDLLGSHVKLRRRVKSTEYQTNDIKDTWDE